MTIINGLVIFPDNTYSIGPVDARFEGLRFMVQGWIEAVQTPDGTTIYLNEEGKLTGLPLNGLATQLWRMLDPNSMDVIVGNAVVLGPVDANGNETPVTEDTIATFTRLVTA